MVDGYEFKTEQDQNIYILNKYCIKQFLNNGATQEQAEKLSEDLIFENKNNLWGSGGLAYQLGKIDFTYFCLYFLQDTFIVKDSNIQRELAQVHYDVWQEIQMMFVQDKWDKEEFILPRGCSKSTIINKALTCYLHCYKKSRYTIVMGNKEDDAVQFIDDTKQMFNNPYIVRAFGKLVDIKQRTVNKQEIELTNNTDIKAFSLNSSVRGTTYGCCEGIFRPSTIILDDILKEDDILSENAKEKIVNKYYKEIAQVGDTEVIRQGKKIKSSSKFIVIGTPLATDDFINTIRLDPTFKVFHRKVVTFNIDKYFEGNEHWQHYNKILNDSKIAEDDRLLLCKEYYTTHKSDMEFPTIWEKYRCDIDIANFYFTKRTAFMQELMCDCQNIGEKWFKSILTNSEKEIAENTFTKTCLVVDPASTVNKSSDFTAMIIGSKSTNGFKIVRKGLLFKLGLNDYCNKVIELLKEYSDITHIIIEKNLYQSADVIKIKELISNDVELKNKNFIFINDMQHQNKDQKISSIVDDVNCGRIIFNENDKDFLAQFKVFSGCRYSLHDDACDAVAEFALKIDSIKSISKVNILDKRDFFK